MTIFDKYPQHRNFLGNLVAHAIDSSRSVEHHSTVQQLHFLTSIDQPQVVGSFGSIKDLAEATAIRTLENCHIAEIRLDLLRSANGEIPSQAWQHLAEIPLLFTARRFEEGGHQPLAVEQRIAMLDSILGCASILDIEVASLAEMSTLIETINGRKISWLASFHDFEKLPNPHVLEEAIAAAKAAGASLFKLAARLNQPADISRLAEFQLADHGIPVATMGMGVLAPVSRLLCAQCGSLLNYGYLGSTPTAPGQWHSKLLKQTISELVQFDRVSI